MALAGHWKFDKSENFEAFLDAIAVSDEKKKLALSGSPNIDVTNNGDHFEIKYHMSEGHTKDISFTVGQEFEETSLDGAHVKSLVTRESDTKLKHVQKGDVDRLITVEVHDNKLTMTMEAKGVTSTRHFVR